MPPKAKIIREMIIDAAFQIARGEGAEHINARTVSEKLGCSTQPVMYHFKTIEELKIAVYQKTDEFHSAYLMDVSGQDPMMEVGMNYIRFGAEEGNLFRFLFQSNGFSGKNLDQLLGAEEIMPILEVLAQAVDVDIRQARRIFKTLFLYVHGYASMFAGNAMEYDEQVISEDLEKMFAGAVLAEREKP